jgi:hypothetical protein
MLQRPADRTLALAAAAAASAAGVPAARERVARDADLA